MRIRSSCFSAIVAGSLCALYTGAGIAQTAGGEHVSPLKTYTLGEMNAIRYDVVGRVWGDSWRSAFWLPTFPTQEQALTAFHTEASRRGADAVLNVSCLDNRLAQWSKDEAAFVCYGIAIRVRPS